MNKDMESAVAAIETNDKRTQARKHLQSAINRLQRSMYDLEFHLESLETAEDDSERAKHLNAAINHLVCTLQPNLRIDLLAQSQAELAVLAAWGAAE